MKTLEEKREYFKQEVKTLERDFIKALRNKYFTLSTTAICRISERAIQLGICTKEDYEIDNYIFMFASGVELYNREDSPVSGIKDKKAEINFGSSGSFDPSNKASFWKTIHAASLLTNWTTTCDLVHQYCTKFVELRDKVYNN